MVLPPASPSSAAMSEEDKEEARMQQQLERNQAFAKLFKQAPLPASPAVHPSKVRTLAKGDVTKIFEAAAAGGGGSVTDLLPVASPLERERRGHHSAPTQGKRKQREPGTRVSSKSAEDVIKQVLGKDGMKLAEQEMIVIREGEGGEEELFCEACIKPVGKEKFLFGQHLKTDMHPKAVLARRTTCDIRDHAGSEVKQALIQQNRQMKTVNEKTLGNRIMIIQCAAAAGTPLNQLKLWKPVIERIGGIDMGDVDRLRDLVPHALQLQLQSVRAEIKGRDVVLFFDGTTHVCECDGFGVRFLNDQLQPQNRLLSLRLIDQALDSRELGLLILEVVRDNNVAWSNVLGLSCDGVSVNRATSKFVKTAATSAVHIVCSSHTCNNAGAEVMKLCPLVTAFAAAMKGIVKHSHRARQEWKAVTSTPDKPGRVLLPPNNTRWWATQEFLREILQHFTKLNVFFANLESQDLCKATVASARLIFDDVVARGRLFAQLVAIDEGLTPLIKLTYNLEGDGVLVFECFEMMQKVDAELLDYHREGDGFHSGRVGSRLLFGATGVADNDNVELAQSLVEIGKSVVKAAYTYYHYKFFTPPTGAKDRKEKLWEQMQLFDKARYFVPKHAEYIDLREIHVMSLPESFPFLAGLVPGMLQELTAYRLRTKEAVANSTYHEADKVLQFFRHWERELPSWYAAAKKVAILPPSSAAIERVFSCLSMIGDQRTHMLSDALLLSCMARYNRTNGMEVA